MDFKAACSAVDKACDDYGNATREARLSNYLDDAKNAKVKSSRIKMYSAKAARKAAGLARYAN